MKLKKPETKVDSLLINFVLDQSGSMQNLRQDVIGGFNTFKKEQQAEGKTYFSLTLFENNSQVVYTNIEDAPDLTEATYVPAGGTALIDATGDAIRALEQSLEKMNAGDRPDKILFVTYTDGGENASTKWKSEDVKQLIADKRDAGWEFVFLGADQDAWQQAHAYGLSAAKGNTMSFAATSAGVNQSFSTLSSASSTYRGANTGTTTQYFSPEDIDQRPGDQPPKTETSTPDDS